DSASNPATSLTAATQLIRDQNVKIIFGPNDAPSSAGVNAKAAEAKVLFVTNGFTIPDRLIADGPDTDLNRYTFAAAPLASAVFGSAVEGYIQKYPTTKTAVVLYSDE